ncbi:MAG TPA: hypothetical protein VFZ04_11390 [Longimicrobiales bacterium]
MKYERAKYEFPIDDIARREKADAPAGVYLLGGRWHLAAHDSLAEACLIDAGALLVATLTFRAPALPADISPIPAAAVLQLYAAHAG